MELVDTHNHLDVEAFDADRAEVVARARDAGVVAQIVPAIEAATWPTLAEVCATHAGLYPAYGLHPLFLDVHRDEHLRALPEWLARGDCVAVGECGLDYYVAGLDRERQRVIFDAQLALAREFDLPVIVHARRAVQDVIVALRRHDIRRGIVHSFAGSAEQAHQLMDLGLHLGFGGPVTYPRARRIRDVVATIPLDHLVLETDAPDQPLCGHQGQRNEPARLTQVLRVVAALRGEPEAAIAEATTRNAMGIFLKRGPRA